MNIKKAEHESMSCFNCINGITRYNSGREWCSFHKEPIPNEFENTPGVCDDFGEKLKESKQ